MLLLLSFICNTVSSDLSLCRPLVRNAVALISSLEEANIRQRNVGKKSIGVSFAKIHLFFFRSFMLFFPISLCHFLSIRFFLSFFSVFLFIFSGTFFSFFSRSLFLSFFLSLPF